MKVELLSKFENDIDKLFNKQLKHAILNIIDNLENANTLSEIQGIKKLKGFSNAYRIKLGDYRIGFYFEKGIIELARVVHRKDIYRVFP